MENIHYLNAVVCTYAVTAKPKNSTLLVSADYCITFVSQFLLDFAVPLEIVSTYAGTVVIGGNVNIHMINFLDNSTINFKNLTQSFNFTQMISEITRNIGHQLDIILTYDPTSALQTSVLSLNISL